jgi:hypothetical protein
LHVTPFLKLTSYFLPPQKWKNWEMNIENSI